MNKKIIIFNALLIMFLIFVLSGQTLAESIYKSAGKGKPIYYNSEDGLIQKYKAVGLKYDGNKLRTIKFGRGDATISINSDQTKGTWSKNGFKGWSNSIFHDYYSCRPPTKGRGSHSSGGKLNEYLKISTNRIKVDGKKRLINMYSLRDKNYRFKNLGLFCIAEFKTSMIDDDDDLKGKDIDIDAKTAMGRFQISEKIKNKDSKVKFTSYLPKTIYSNYNEGESNKKNEEDIDNAYYLAYILANLNIVDPEIKYHYWNTKKDNSIRQTGLLYSMAQYALWKNDKLGKFLDDITENKHNSWQTFCKTNQSEDTKLDKYSSETTKKQVKKLVTAATEYQAFCKANNGDCISNKTKGKPQSEDFKFKYKDATENEEGELFGPFKITYACKNGTTQYVHEDQYDAKNDKFGNTYIWGALKSIKAYTDISNDKSVKINLLNSKKKEIDLPLSGEPFYVWVSKKKLGKAKKIFVKATYKKMICSADFVLVSSKNGSQGWIVVASSDMKYETLTKTMKAKRIITGEEADLTIEKKDEDTKKGIKAGFKIRYYGVKYNYGSTESYNEYINWLVDLLKYLNSKNRNWFYNTYIIEKTYPWVQIFRYTNVLDYRNLDYELLKQDRTFINKVYQYKELYNKWYEEKYDGTKWLSGSIDNIKYDKSNISAAQEYYTDENGRLEIPKLESGTYTIFETSIQTEGYELTQQLGYDKDIEAVNCGNVEVSSKTSEEETSTDEAAEDEGEVDYKDEDEQNDESNTDEDSNTDNDGSNEDGTDDLSEYAEENESEEPGEIDDEEGSENENTGNNETNYTIPEIEEEKTKANVEAKTNHLIVYNSGKITIKGYVWLDGKSGKANVTNGLWDNNEEKISGVKVELVNKKTKEVKASVTITNAKEGYTFENVISKAELGNYYINFDYSRTEHKDNPIVGFNSKKINGCRTVEGSGGKANTYQYTGSKEQEQKYGLSGNILNILYDTKKRILQGINLGIFNRGKDITAIQENLSYVIISFGSGDNRKNFTYEYGGEPISFTPVENGPVVQYQTQNRPGVYTREFYPSEIVYNNKHPNDSGGLTVKVIYRIDLINSATHNNWVLTGDDTSRPPGETEKKLYITKLRNSYDSSRYEIDTTGVKLEEWKKDEESAINQDIAKWKGSGGEAYNESDPELQGIEEYGTSKKIVTTYIQFKVKDDSLINMLMNNPDGVNEAKPTKAYVNKTEAYWKYKEQDKYHWDEDWGHWSSPDPETGRSYWISNIKHFWKWQGWKDMTKNIAYMEDSAPYINMKLRQDRTISGTVFKDKVTEESKKKQEVLGNGTIDEGEEPVENVKVELIDENDQVVPLYTSDNREKTDEQSLAVTVTDEEGNYSLSGFIPGKYRLRYTYGDNTNGEYNTKIDWNYVNPKDYKSTIITSNSVQNAFDNGDLNWYRKVEKNKSIARDDLSKNKGGRQYTNSFYETKEKNYLIDKSDYSKMFTVDNEIEDKEPELPSEGLAQTALSPQFEIVIENMKDVYRQVISDGRALNDEGKIATYQLDRENFGIIEQPHQKMEFKKIISNVKLINANGNIVFDGNPEITPKTDPMPGVMDLDNVENEGSTFTRATAKTYNLYGSTLEITYDLSLTNKSDVNYQNDRYYWYGQPGNQVTLKPTVIDYLDDTQTFESELSPGVTDSKKANSVDFNDVNELEIKGESWGEIKANETVTKRIVATRKLSDTGDDMEMLNFAKVISIKRFGDYAIPDIDINRYDQTRMIVTPPEGKDMQVIVMYSVSSIIALISISTGIVLIKKKVL